MSIGYNEMYNVTAGIFTCFSAKKVGKRLLTINHPRKKREKMEKVFPVSKYNLMTKENFVLANLYVNFKETSSSLNGTIDKLRDLDEKKMLKFKNEIINYRKFLNEDIDRINIEESSVSLSYMIDEYRANRIHWFTFYFYIEASGEEGASLEEIGKSRINSVLVRKIQKLLLYVTFSDASKASIKKLMSNRIEI